MRNKVLWSRENTTAIKC